MKIEALTPPHSIIYLSLPTHTPLSNYLYLPHPRWLTFPDVRSGGGGKEVLVRRQEEPGHGAAVVGGGVSVARGVRPGP
jgi:hypothetical protein